MAHAAGTGWRRGFGYFYSANQEKVYEARASLLVQQRRMGLEPRVNFSVSQELADTYSRQVRSTPFLERLAQDPDVTLSAGRLRGMVSASTGSRPPTVEIKVKDSDPVLAYTTADKVAEEFIDYVVELRLAEIGRLQTAAVAQGLSNVPGLISAQYGLIDSLTILDSLVKTRFEEVLAS